MEKGLRLYDNWLQLGGGAIKAALVKLEGVYGSDSPFHTLAALEGLSKRTKAADIAVWVIEAVEDLDKHGFIACSEMKGAFLTASKTSQLDVLAAKYRIKQEFIDGWMTKNGFSSKDVILCKAGAEWFYGILPYRHPDSLCAHPLLILRIKQRTWCALTLSSPRKLIIRWIWVGLGHVILGPPPV